MKKRYRVAIILGLILGVGFIIPEPRVIPVLGATAADWNKDTFWYEPWGSPVYIKASISFRRTVHA
jgi:hypothetical protein